MPETVVDFWKMLWENNVKIVVMACNEYEGIPRKVCRYFKYFFINYLFYFVFCIYFFNIIFLNILYRFFLLLVLSPKMTCKTSQMSLYLCGVSIFKTSRLQVQDCCADVDETWHLYSTGRGTNFWEAEF